MPKNKILFNFAFSYSGGGLKRLEAYIRKFNELGGAYFMVNFRLKGMFNEYHNNVYFLIKYPSYKRFFNDSAYIDLAIKEINEKSLDLYYSYGVPVHYKYANKSWLHISNILPFSDYIYPISFMLALKMRVLRRYFQEIINILDFISSESEYSIGLLKDRMPSSAEYILSINGQDSEGEYYGNNYSNYAIIIGSYSYKLVNESYLVYKNLLKKNKNLSLIIVGFRGEISNFIIKDKNVKIINNLSHNKIQILLRKASFYISSTVVENSFNNASEGIYQSREALISDIPPHRELLEGQSYQNVIFPDIKHKNLRFISYKNYLYVKRDNLSVKKLKKWDFIINDILVRIR